MDGDRLVRFGPQVLRARLLRMARRVAAVGMHRRLSLATLNQVNF